MSDRARILQIGVSPGALCLFSQERDSRVYARVLREGSLTSGDPVRLLTEDEASSRLGAR